MNDIGMPVEERERLVKKYYRYMERYMAHLLYGVERNRWPILQMELSGGTYTTVGDPSRKLVHLDLGPSVYLEDEQGFVNACEVFIGHEVQHIRSTAAKSWLYGLNNGKVAICQEYMKKSSGQKRILNNAKQADAYIKELQDKGYHISKNSIEELVHFIMNSIEDGRIERILCVHRPGFRKKLSALRGMEWLIHDANGEGMPGFDNPRDYLGAVLNQVLSLSTMSIYQKGFVLASSGSNRAYRQVQELIPYIARGVAAESCKSGMDAAIEICRILALDIMEAAKMTPLEELLQQLIKNFSEAASYSADSLNEEKDGSQGESLFGKSDLVIELEDEEYDKLEEQMKGKEEDGFNGPRILIKRKHPKKEKDGSGNSGGKGQTGDSKEKPDNREKTDQKSPGSGTESGKDEKSAEAAGSCGACGNGPQPGSTTKDPSSGETKEEKAPSKESHSGKDTEGKRKKKEENGNKASEKEIETAIEHAVRNSVQSGVNETVHEAEEASRAAAHDAAQEGKPSVIRSKEDGLPDLSCVNDAYQSLPKNFTFYEVQRNYNPTLRMPLAMQNKAEVLKRKLIQVLKNQCEPDMRERKSGILDNAFLYKLAMGNMECFIQKGMETSFNGCAYILMDRSGSMHSNGKFEKCCESLAMIEHSFTDILPMKIAAFNASSDNCVMHEVIKNWHEKLPYNGSYNFFRNRFPGSGNKDGYSIRIAATELLAQQYESKLLIVLSDGLPSCYNGWEEGLADVKAAVHSAREKGINVVSIFFGDKKEEEQFRLIYENRNCIVTNPENIGDELYKILKDSVVNQI